MSAAPLRIVALLAVVALVLSACGQATKDSASDFQGEQKAVAQTVEDLQSAASKSDEGKICGELLAPALVTRIKAAGKGTCESALSTSLKDADSFELQVKKVAVDGSTATVTVESDATGSKKRTDTLQLVKSGAGWRIATLGNAS